VVLIPAYEPDFRLGTLISELREQGFDDIVVVDDGSGEDFQPIFLELERAGVVFLQHQKNRGKGAALRTGFEHIRQYYPEAAGVVTVDADGQHAAREAAVVARACQCNSASLALGVRCFNASAAAPVPLRSWLGNTFSRLAYGVVLKQPLRDTQCGLRGIPATLLPWMLRLQGDRYEYETNMLMSANRAGIEIREVPIQTVYLEGNRSSHFRFLTDSMRIYAVVLRFYLSSLAAAAVDLSVFAAMWRLTAAYTASFVVARLVSSLANFAVNREFVFRGGTSMAGSLARYYGLVALLGVLSYGLSRLMISSGLPVFGSKIGADVILSVLSFLVQRGFVFRKTAAAADGA
jgi:glycosyltransferase involved in cell wall biosynthesis